MSGNDPRRNRRSVLRNAQSTESDRRSVLHAAATAVLGALGVSGSAAAAHTDLDIAGLQAAAREYHSTERVREALDEYAIDLLAELADRDLLDSASIGELPVESLRTVDELGRGVEGVAVGAVERDDTPTAKIQIQKRISDRTELVLTVVPDGGESMAAVRPTDSGGSLGALDGTTTISPSSHCSDCTYTGGICKVYCGPYSCTCKIANQYDCADGSCCSWGDLCGSCSSSGC